MPHEPANTFGLNVGGDEFIDVVTHPVKGGMTEYNLRHYRRTFNRTDLISKTTYDRESDLHEALAAFGVEANESLSHLKFVRKKAKPVAEKTGKKRR